MNQDKLKVVAATGKEDKSSVIPKTIRRDESRAKFERMWLLNQSQFDPERNVMQREWLNRIWDLISAHVDLPKKEAVDLGCGKGVLAIRLANAGANVTAVDIASNALEALKAKQISNLITKLEYVPRTTFSDNAFDLVIAKDLIAYLPEKEYRLFFSELARVVKAEGFVVASAPIDIDSSDSLQRFISLSETELIIIQWVFGYHAFYIRLLRLLSVPSHLVRASTNQESRNDGLSKRRGVSRSWYKINTTPMVGKIWYVFSLLMNPILNYVKQSKGFLLFLEKICKGVSPIFGISNAAFIGKRRPIMQPVAEEQKPFDRPVKTRIWE